MKPEGFKPEDLIRGGSRRWGARRRVLDLLREYLTRAAERGGLVWEYACGIPLGCPLSPVIAPFFLSELDAALTRQGAFFVRFMDDLVVLAPTHWKLHRMARAVNQTLHALGLAKHPEKTYINRVSKGFDFLGYHFTPAGLTLAESAVAASLTRARRLYEQGPGGRAARHGEYAPRPPDVSLVGDGWGASGWGGEVRGRGPQEAKPGAAAQGCMPPASVRLRT